MHFLAIQNHPNITSECDLSPGIWNFEISLLAQGLFFKFCKVLAEIIKTRAFFRKDQKRSTASASTRERP
jgi:hypothetical protein